MAFDDTYHKCFFNDRERYSKKVIKFEKLGLEDSAHIVYVTVNYLSGKEQLYNLLHYGEDPSASNILGLNETHLIKMIPLYIDGCESDKIILLEMNQKFMRDK